MRENMAKYFFSSFIAIVGLLIDVFDCCNGNVFVEIVKPEGVCKVPWWFFSYYDIREIIASLRLIFECGAIISNMLFETIGNSSVFMILNVCDKIGIIARSLRLIF